MRAPTCSDATTRSFTDAIAAERYSLGTVAQAAAPRGRYLKRVIEGTLTGPPGGASASPPAPARAPAPRPEAVARSLARSTGIQLVGHAAGLGLGLLSFALLTRYLGVRGYGQLSLFAAAVGVVSSLAGGLDTAALRRLAAGGARPGPWSELLGLRAAFSGVLLLAGLLAALVVPATATTRLAIAAAGLALALSTLQAALTTSIRARPSFGVPVALDVLTRALLVGGYAVVLALGIEANGSAGSRTGIVLVLSAVVALVVLLATLVPLRGERLPLRPRYSRRAWLDVGREAAPLGLFVVLGIVNYRVDLVLLGALKDTAAVGIYGIANRFMDALLPLGGFLVGSAFPLLARRRATLPALQQAVAIVIAASLPLALAVFLAAPTLVSVFAGSEFQAAVLPLRLLALSLPFSFLAMLVVYAYIAAEKRRLLLALTSATIGGNVVLNVALVPRFGPSGSAAATLVAEAIGCAVLLAFAAAQLGLRPNRSLIARTAGAGLAMVAVAAAATGTGAVTQAALSLGAYAAAALALRLVRPADVALLLRSR
jgi:O-antigen/teichoic acid export membrane protein